MKCHILLIVLLQVAILSGSGCSFGGRPAPPDRKSSRHHRLTRMETLWWADHQDLKDAVGNKQIHIFNVAFKRISNDLDVIEKDISSAGKKKLKELREEYDSISESYRKFKRAKRIRHRLKMIGPRMQKLLKEEIQKAGRS